MKNLKRLTCLVIMIIMISAFVLTGCGGLKDNPAINATVYSNGGMSVIKGDYLYYVNGFVDEDKLTDAKTENVSGKVVKGALYRTKITNGIQKDKDGFIKDANGNSLTECVVSKIVGFSNGGFHIVDDFIYYATPCMTYSSSAETSETSDALQNELVEFHRVKIDGTDDKLIYTTTEQADILEWNVTKIGSKVYITSFSGKTIMIANASDNKVITTINDVTSCALPEESTYSKDSYSGTAHLNNYIYYTRAVTADDKQTSTYKGNVVCNVKVSSGETSVVKYDVANTYSIKFVKNDALYYTKSSVLLGDQSPLYKNKLANNSFASSQETCVALMDGVSSYLVLDYEYNHDSNGVKTTPVSTNTNVVVGVGSSGKIYRFETVDGAPQSSMVTKLLNSGSSSTKLLEVVENDLYVVDSNVIYKINVKADLSLGEAEKVLVSKDNYTYLVTNKNYFDVTDNYLFAYAEFKVGEESNYYLTYIDIANDYTSRFVGEFAEGHTPEQPEQAEGYDEKDPNCEVPYTPWID